MLGALVAARVATAIAPVAGDAPVEVAVAPGQLLALAAGWGRQDLADRASLTYRALAADPDPDIRTEARFRLSTSNCITRGSTALASPSPSTRLRDGLTVSLPSVKSGTVTKSSRRNIGVAHPLRRQTIGTSSSHGYPADATLRPGIFD